MIHAKIPIRNENEFEIIADYKGVQINILTPDMCTFRIEIDEDFEFSLKHHYSNKVVYQTNLQKLYEEL